MSRGTGDAVDLFQRYMRDVRRQAGLDAEEEERLTLVLEDGRRAAAELASSPEGASRRALAERERRGREARDRIVLGNLRFVVHVATRFVGRRGIQGLELLDLIQEATSVFSGPRSNSNPAAGRSPPSRRGGSGAASTAP